MVKLGKVGDEEEFIYLSPDVLKGREGDQFELTVMGAGEMKKGSLGLRLQLPVSVSVKGVILEKLFSVSPRNENRLKTLFGRDTETWLTQKFMVYLADCDVAKSGLQISVVRPPLSA